jgi:MFS family permease
MFRRGWTEAPGASGAGKADSVDTGRARTAVASTFVVNGIYTGAWGGALPALRSRVHTDATGVSLLLVVTAAAAIVSMQIGGRIADRIGARRPTLVSAAVLVFGLSLIALLCGRSAPRLWWMVPCAAVFGFGNGTMDVCMNALAVDVERRRGRASMGRFHGFYSIGGFVGAGLVALVGGLVANLRWQLPLALGAAAVGGVVVMLAFHRRLPETAPVEHEHGSGSGIPAAAWLLAAMAVCFGLTEGTAVDWSSIHVTDVGHVSPGTGAIGLASVSALMVLVRLFGDHVVERIGRRAVVAIEAALTVLGFAGTVVLTPLPLILLSWCLVGLGVGMIAPQIYGLAGQIGGGRGLAIVVGCGYGAFLAGPGILGVTVSSTGIRHAMLVPLCTALLLVLGATRMPRLRAGE